jgi:hypothetical protein
MKCIRGGGKEGGEKIRGGGQGILGLIMQPLRIYEPSWINNIRFI